MLGTGYLAFIRRGLLGEFVDETREAHVAGRNGQPNEGIEECSKRFRTAARCGYDSCSQTGRNCWKRCRLRKGFTVRDLVQGCVNGRADQRLRLSTAQPPTRASGGHKIDNPQSRSAIAK